MPASTRAHIVDACIPANSVHSCRRQPLDHADRQSHGIEFVFIRIPRLEVIDRERLAHIKPLRMIATELLRHGEAGRVFDAFSHHFEPHVVTQIDSRFNDGGVVGIVNHVFDK